MLTRRSTRRSTTADAEPAPAAAAAVPAAASSVAPSARKKDPRRKSFFDNQKLSVASDAMPTPTPAAAPVSPVRSNPTSSSSAASFSSAAASSSTSAAPAAAVPAPSSWSAAASLSGRKHRKRRSSTIRETKLTDDEPPGKSVPVAQPAAAAAPPTKKANVRKTLAEGGFEFSKKQKTGSNSASELAVSTSASSAPSSSSSSSVAPTPTPKLPAPSYPSSKDRDDSTTSFHFDSDAPLVDASMALFRDILAAEQALVVKTYGAGSKSKLCANGRLQFVVDACAGVADEFLRTVKPQLEAHLEREPLDARRPVVENPANVAKRDELDRWNRLAAQAEADVQAWKAINERLEKQAKEGSKPVQGELSAEQETMLSTLDGGSLRSQLVSLYARQAVKGDAAAHTLERLSSFVSAVQSDQKAMARHINAQERKVYGKAVDDPRELIAMITAQSQPTAAAAASDSAGGAKKEEEAASAAASSGEQSMDTQ